jgi:diacylglycerol kinase (CTP)
MAQAVPIPLSHTSHRAASPSGIKLSAGAYPSSPSASTPPPPSRARSTTRISKRSSSRESKENIQPSQSASRINGTFPPEYTHHLGKPRGMSEVRDVGNGVGNGGTKSQRDGSTEQDITESEHLVRARRTSSRAKSPSYNGLPTFPPIPADPDAVIDDSKVPPPSSSAGTSASGIVRPVTRPRRSSSIKRKPSPGVTPTKVVDWEIPRKTLHSSIGALSRKHPVARN